MCPIAGEEWDVGEASMNRGGHPILDELVVAMVNLLSRLKLENHLLLTSVLQAIGKYESGRVKSAVSETESEVYSIRDRES